MNNEQYNYLLKFKDHMRLAQESGYTRNISKSDRVEIKNIVELLTKQKFTKNLYCSSCLVEMLLIVKKHFDKYEQKLAKKNQQLNEQSDGETEEV